MKYSKQRELILNTVKEEAVHPTADDVYHKLKSEHPNLSLGTVYRNLNLLVERGLIKKVPVTTGKDRFDGTVKDHCHMECVQCGQIVDIMTEEPKHLGDRIAKESGEQIISCEILLRGICKKCLSERQA